MKLTHKSAFLMLVACLLLSLRASLPPARLPADAPRLLDERLELTLVAADPDIVTPIGIAVDKKNRIFVLESHTHLPPAGYKGPKTDLIKLLEDDNGDGRPERIRTFAEGLKEGLNLAFSPEGVLYAVTSRTVWALYDRNDDGVCDEKKKILELTRPASVYAHAALLGLTFSPDGWLYVSRGNTGGAAWKLEGSDGSALSGYGDGGNIVRARPDGSALEEVATGFWNPVDLKLDAQGRLLTIDNDPDSRGPNRLVHVVPGGNYGYKSLYGGSGIHPFLAWNGELPGTLPYAVGLGEAPTGLLRADDAALPADYAGELLCSIWEESRLVRIKTRPQGASLTGTVEVIAEGAENFRPVAFAVGPDGAIYLTDWVLRDYPNHGRGRIWKLTTRPGVAVRSPGREKAPESGPSGHELESLYAARQASDFGRLQDALASGDPFIRHAAVVALSRPVFRPEVLKAATDARAAVRLGALLALQRSQEGPAAPVLRQALADADPQIRRQALQGIGEAGLTDLRPELETALKQEPITAELFDTYLETVAHLMPDFRKAYERQSESAAKSIKRPLPPKFIENLVSDATQSATLRALALRYLPQPEQNQTLLLTMTQADQQAPLRLEAVRTLAGLPSAEVGQRLLQIARGRSNPVPLRTEALLALARQPIVAEKSVMALLEDPSVEVQLEAARYLRSRLDPARLNKLPIPNSGVSSEAVRQQMQLGSAGTQKARRSRSLADWEALLAREGQAERGRRVFYSVQASCSACHRVEGRGGDLGPDLSNIGRSKSRRQLIHSILRPSKEITPEWQGWYIRLHSGEEYQGRQIDIGDRTIELYTQAAGMVNLARKDVKEYGLVRTSLMPEGLESQLTEHDLRDLLSFLQKAR